MEKQKQKQNYKEIESTLSDISEKEILSRSWTRAIIKDISIHKTYIFAKKEDLSEDYRFATTQSFEITNKNNNPKKSLKLYKRSSTPDGDYHNHLFKNWSQEENLDKIKSLKYDHSEWVYKSNKKIRIEIESLDGSYKNDFFIDQKQNQDINVLYDRLKDRLGKSFLIKKRKGQVISRFDKNNIPSKLHSLTGKFLKYTCLITCFFTILFSGIFAIVYSLFMVLSILNLPELISAILLFGIIFGTIKYQVMIYLYSWKYTEKLNDYLNRKKYILR